MRIGIFLRHAFHESILGPVTEHLSTAHECRMFLPVRPATPDATFSMTPLRNCIAEMIAFKPHVVLSGEDVGALRLRTYLPKTLFVHTRHGLASKGTTYRSVRAADFACVSSAFMRDWYVAANAVPRQEFWIVGYPQMDALFDVGAAVLPFDLPKGNKTLLYAPTFQSSLSSAPLLGDRVVELLRGAQANLNIVIKPHPLIGDLFPEWLAVWKQLAATKRNVYLVEDTHADVMPFLKAADVLVTDVSSVSLEYLALNRPMVLITSPRIDDEGYVDKNGLEWRWRDMGEEIFDVNHLPQAVARALRHPDHGAARRQFYRSLLFGELADGNTSLRLAEHVNALASQAAATTQMAMAAAVGHTTMALVNTRERIRAWRTNQ